MWRFCLIPTLEPSLPSASDPELLPVAADPRMLPLLSLDSDTCNKVCFVLSSLENIRLYISMTVNYLKKFIILQMYIYFIVEPIQKICRWCVVRMHG